MSTQRSLQGNLQTASANIITFTSTEIDVDVEQIIPYQLSVPGVNPLTDMVIAINLVDIGDNLIGSVSLLPEITDMGIVTFYITGLLPSSSIAAGTQCKLLIGRFENWTFSAL